MIYVPDGEFLMGSRDSDPKADSDEGPRHTVTLDAFWIDQTCYGTSPDLNPQGPDSGVRNVFRGGSWGYPSAFIRASDRARNRPTYAGFGLGFRCAAPAASLPS